MRHIRHHVNWIHQLLRNQHLTGSLDVHRLLGAKPLLTLPHTVITSS